ncbi:hypothetical protein RJ640_011043 [Escallonia rubra]|uniref:HEAT repeat-containing protein n=1 Tax=Escallonia rubra TaxID=112253 RepID=A0AA88UMH0_9ASTE|nr:hypothetical protein RJ640_011043 [Escallonia rubra]
MIADPELPGHLLLEQYQAQLVSAIRTALDTSSGPILLEAGLQLATKILTSGVISGDKIAVKRIFSLISRPLDDFKDLYYPSFAEWVSCKWNPFLDGIQSLLVSSKLQHCLEDAWPVILQAVALDAVPVNFHMNESSKNSRSTSLNASFSGYSMVELEPEEYQFIWGFALLILFQGQDTTLDRNIIPVGSVKSKFGGDTPSTDPHALAVKLYEIVLPVFQFLSTERFFSMEFLTKDIGRELLQVFSYSILMEDTWDSLAISVLLQILQNCPAHFYEADDFANLASELCLAFIFKFIQSFDATSPFHPNWEDKISVSLTAAMTLISRLEPKKQFQLVLPFLLIGYKCIGGASTELCFSKATEYVHSIGLLLRKHVDNNSSLGDDTICYLRTTIGACLDVIPTLTKECIRSIHPLENKRSNFCKLLQMKLAFSLEEVFAFAKLAYEMECLGENKESRSLLYKMLHHCTQCIQDVLTDWDIQVQAVGLQVLKRMIQRSTNEESNSFLLFFTGELLGNLLTIIQQILKKPINKEAVAIVGECMRILMLLQALSKANECQKGLMTLLLETAVLVFSASEDGPSQEVNDLKSTGIRLVSQIAQVPSSAAYFKDVLLAMPVTQRQLLQGMIRASVTQEQKPTQTKSAVPALVIKLPAQTEETRQKSSFPPSSVQQIDENREEEEEEDDDWDAFQSFPASTHEIPHEISPSVKVESTAEESTINERYSISDSTSGNNESQEFSSSQSLSKVNDSMEEAVDGNMIFAVVGNSSMKAPGSQDSGEDTEECTNHRGEKDGVAPSPKSDQALPDLQSFEDTQLSDYKPEVKIGELPSHENDQNLSVPKSNEVEEGYIEPSDSSHDKM